MMIRTLSAALVLIATMSFGHSQTGPWAPEQLAQDGPVDSVDDTSRRCGVHSETACLLDSQGSTYDDLAPLASIVGDARLVALGESVHRSGGLLAIKTRVIQYLVEELGFRAVAFETEWTRGEIVSAYLDSCAGDPVDVVRRGIRNTWQSQEVVELFAWLCEFNQAHPDDPVGFFGFNNFQPWDDVPALLSAADSLLGERAASVQAGLATCEGAGTTDEASWRVSFTTVEESAFQSCIEALDSIDAALASFEGVPADQVATWRRHSASLRGWEGYQYHEGLAPNPNGLNSRDRAMAEILQSLWQERHPGAKLVISSHNLHINRASDSIETIFPPPAAAAGILEGSTRMGNHLGEALAGDYVPIGLVCYRCGIEETWVSVLPDQFPPMSTGVQILEAQLHTLFGADVLLDLELPQSEPSEVSFAEPIGLTIALSAEIVGVIEAVPSSLYRAVIFIDESEQWSRLP